MANCYHVARDDNPGLNMTVALGSVEQISTDQVHLFMDAVAEHHADSTVNVAYNSAGRAAIREAMRCIWSLDAITLSSVFLNQEVPDLQIISTTMVREVSGVPLGDLDFTGVGQTCAQSSGPAMMFGGAGGTAHLAAIALPFASFDLGINLSTGIDVPACADFLCGGSCVQECEESGGDWYHECYCAADPLSACGYGVETGFMGSGPLIVIQ